MSQFIQPVELTLGRIMLDINQVYDRVYFPVSGVVSQMSVFESGAVSEIAAVGREGLLPVRAILRGEESVGRHVVQVPGSALVISRADFQKFRQELPKLDQALFAFARVFLDQALQSVACNSIHSIHERAARWLLTCHDRSEADTFPLTQEFLAALLGASRPTVNLVARTLQAAGYIRYTRGKVTIEDRAGLEDSACECYALIRSWYERVFPGAFGK